MQLQFVRPVQDADHSDVEHTASLVRKTIAAPRGAPAIFGDEFLEGPVEIVGILHRRLNVIPAEHGAANFEPLSNLALSMVVSCFEGSTSCRTDERGWKSARIASGRHRLIWALDHLPIVH